MPSYKNTAAGKRPQRTATASRRGCGWLGAAVAAQMKTPGPLRRRAFDWNVMVGLEAVFRGEAFPVSALKTSGVETCLFARVVDRFVITRFRSSGSAGAKANHVFF
jgi:hypothetical protein